MEEFAQGELSASRNIPNKNRLVEMHIGEH